MAADLSLRVNGTIRADVFILPTQVNSLINRCENDSLKSTVQRLKTRIQVDVRSPMKVPVKLTFQDLVTRRISAVDVDNKIGRPKYGLRSAFSNPESHFLHPHDFAALQTYREIDPGESNSFFSRALFHLN